MKTGTAWLLGAALASAAPPPDLPNAAKTEPGDRGTSPIASSRRREMEEEPGPEITYAARPSFPKPLRACSARVPVCVHASSTVDGPTALATLSAFERAWTMLTGALALQAPDVHPETLTYDVFVEPMANELASTQLEARDVRSRIDRARAFSRVDPRVRAGCVLDALAASAVARASLFRVAPATNDGIARSQAAYLADLANPCAIGLAGDAVAFFQEHAEATFADAHVGEAAPVAGGPVTAPSHGAALFSRGAATFWARVDWAFGRTPGGIVAATWALAPTMTPVGGAHWMNEPDVFDVLRATFKGALSTGSTIADLWLDFGVARAFLGSADDGLHLPELRTLGAAARVPIAWDVPWPTTPRRLAPRTPVAPMGASYLVVHRDGAKPGARLRAEITWEEHALFRWSFVKIDRDGRELGRVPIPTTERATQAQMTLVGLDEVDRILLVGVNVGDPAYAFDPDDEVWEPHGWLVTIAEE